MAGVGAFGESLFLGRRQRAYLSKSQFSSAERHRPSAGGGSGPPWGDLGRAWGRVSCDSQNRRPLRCRWALQPGFCRASRGWAQGRIFSVGDSLPSRGGMAKGAKTPWLRSLPTFCRITESRSPRGSSGGEERESFNPQSSTAPQAKRKRFSRTESPPGSRVKSAAPTGRFAGFPQQISFPGPKPEKSPGKHRQFRRRDRAGSHEKW